MAKMTGTEDCDLKYVYESGDILLVNIRHFCAMANEYAEENSGSFSSAQDVLLNPAHWLEAAEERPLSEFPTWGGEIRDVVLYKK